MRLTSVSIINFGRLHDYHYDFGTGLNILCEENGWGKSTLAAFIKAMLYGFEGEANKDPAMRERHRYMPWNGGTYGGTLSFECAGKRYNVTRIFGARKSLDTFDLRNADTNMPSDDYSDRLGEELFSIDSESFIKTILVRQNSSSVTGSTGDIDSKLGNISDSIDINCFQSADDILKDYINSLNFGRKNSEAGKLKIHAGELKAAILELKSSERMLADNVKKVADNNSRISEIKCELEDIRNRRNTFYENEKLNTIVQTYNDLMLRRTDKLDELNAAADGLFTVIPSPGDAANWRTAIDKYKETEQALEDSFYDVDDGDYEELDDMFAGLDDEMEHIDEYYDMAVRADKLKREIDNYSLTDEETEDFSYFSSLFEHISDPVGTIKHLIERNMLKNRLVSQNAATDREIFEAERGEVSEDRKGLGVLTLVCVTCFLLCAGFGYLFINRNDYLYLIPALVMFVIYVITGVAYIRKRRRISQNGNLNSARIDSLMDVRESNERLIDEISEETDEFITACGLEADEDEYGQLRELLDCALSYEALLKKGKALYSLNWDNSFDNLIGGLNDFFKLLDIEPDSDSGYALTIAEIRAKYNDYRNIVVRKHKADKAMALRSKIEHYFELEFYKAGAIYNQDTLIRDVDRLLLILANIEVINGTISELDSMIDKLMADNPQLDPGTKAIKSTYDIEKLAESESGYNAEMETLIEDNERRQKDIYAYERNICKYNELVEELKEAEQKLARMEKEYNTAILTRNFLKAAKENLTSAYMDPVMKNFERYYRMLTGDNADGYMLDANLNITRREEGMQHSARDLSQGIQDLIGLCMRLALADAMYPDEKPLLIFDDPFVNLDDRRIAKCREFLEKVSLDYQIIYFTCSAARG